MTRDAAIAKIDRVLDQQLNVFLTALTQKVREGVLDVVAATDAHEAAIEQRQKARRFCIEQIDAAETD